MTMRGGKNMMDQEQHGLLGSVELLKLVLEVLPVGVWIMDRSGRIIHGNPMGQRIWAGARYVGIEQFGEYKGWWRSNGKRIAPEEWAAARAIAKGETSLNEEIEIECFDGTHKIILNSALPIRDASGAIIGGIIVNTDITERVALEEKLREAASTDELTGACNRRRFYELLREEMQRAARYGRSLSVIMFDVDNFKQINDRHGHVMGDEVLVLLSAIVRDEIREGEHLARFGGDEFLITLPETSEAAAAHLADRLLAALARRPHPVVGAISCSFGVCGLRPGETPDELIRRADQALYRAKAAGRARVVLGTDRG